MPLPALHKFEQTIERQLRLLELKKTVIERNIGRQIRLFEQKRDGIGKKIEEQIRQFERKRGIRLDDEVRFLRSWIERPLTIGAVTPRARFWRAPWRAMSIPTATDRWSNWGREPGR